MPSIGPLELLIIAFLLLPLIVAPVVLVVTLVRRGRRDPCWHCGRPVDPGSLACPACGAQSPAAGRPPTAPAPPS